MEKDEEEDDQRGLRDYRDEVEEEEQEEGGVAYTEPNWGPGATRARGRGTSSSAIDNMNVAPGEASYYAAPPVSLSSSFASSPSRSAPSLKSRRTGSSSSESGGGFGLPKYNLPTRCSYSYATDDPLAPDQAHAEAEKEEEEDEQEGDVVVLGDQVRDAYYVTPYGTHTPVPLGPSSQLSGHGDSGGVEWRRDPYAYSLDGDDPGLHPGMGYTSGSGGGGKKNKGRSMPGIATSTMAYGQQRAAEGRADSAGGKKPERRKLSLSATLNQKTSYDEQCERDWNALLQSILELPEDTLERRAKKVKELQRLCLDFSRVVCRFGELIIREIVLDDDEKTLKPVRSFKEGSLGVAGGDKFIVAGCFFKFLKDSHGIYDGDEFAMKSGNAELRGLKAMSSLGFPELCFPLVAIVDFRGYRLLASSRLPLGSETLKYGSSNAGRQFHSSVGRINTLMKRVCHSLNLKAHKHPIDAAEIYGPCDIEVHIGRDRRVYVVDAARLMPPSAGFDRGKVMLVPADAARALEVLEFHLNKKANLYVAVAQWFEQRFRGNSSAVKLIYRRLEEYDAVIVFQKLATQDNARATHFAQHTIKGDAIIVKGARGQWLYNFLRPEAVKSCTKPLNSDSLSGFPTHDILDNKEVEDATYHLLKVTIPRLAAKLDNRELVFVNSKQLIQMVHEHGVNLRFLAYLRSLVHNTHIKRFLLSEMISRAVKAALRGKMRTITAHRKKERAKLQGQFHEDDEDEAYKEVAVQYFNLILGMGNESNECWRTDVKILLLLKYSLVSYSGRDQQESQEGDDAKRSSLLDIEHLNNYHFREQIGSKLMLFQMLQKYTGIKFDHETQQLFIADPTQFEQECPFSLYDVQITSCIKTIQYAGKLPDLLHQSFSPGVNGRTQHTPPQPPIAHTRSADSEEGLFEMELEKSSSNRGTVGRPRDAQAVVATAATTAPSGPAPSGPGCDLQRYEENLQLVSDICGHNSLEAVLSLFQVADLHSRQGFHPKALKLIHTACKTLQELGECPAEIVIGFYYLLGFAYERMGDYRRAIRAFETSLDIMERVYGDAREPCGRGLGHPFGLLLCSKLVDLTEHEHLFAAAFRFSKKFEDFWKIFPFPMKGVASAHLTERIFFSNDPPLALFGGHAKNSLVPDDAPTRAWLKRVNVFDNLGDVMVSTLMLGGEDGFFDEATLSPNMEDEDSNESTEEEEQQTTAAAPNAEQSVAAKPTLRQSSRNVPMMASKPATATASSSSGNGGGSLWLWGQGRNASLEGSGYNLERPCLLSGISSPVVDVSCSSTHALLLLESGEVFTVADKLVDHGGGVPVPQATRAKGDGALTPHQVTQLQKKGRRVTKVGCASGFNVAVTRGGKVYGWGSSSFFPLRTKDNRTATPGVPHTVLKGKRVVDVACGEHHALFITGQGEVYSLGTGVLGALGQGTTVDQLVEPKQILSLQKENVARAAAGEDFSLVLTRDGLIYSFGAADRGQLGHPNPQDVPTGYPCPVEALRQVKITKIAAGHQHAIAINEYGEMYLWGANDSGQLGFDTEEDEQLVPRHLPFGLPVVDAAGGKSHTAIIDQAGRVHSWGARAWSQLGHGSQAAAVREPRVVQGLMHVRAVKVAATYGLTLALTEKVDADDASATPMPTPTSSSSATVVPPLMLPSSLSEPALMHARGRIAAGGLHGGNQGQQQQQLVSSKPPRKRNKKEQLIQRHILHHAAPNLSSLRFASKERQQASIALRDKLMKRPSRDELIRRQIIRPVGATSTSTSALHTTSHAVLHPPRLTSSSSASSSSSSSSSSSVVSLRRSGTAVADKSQKKKEEEEKKKSQILLPIDNSSRHHEYHGEQLLSDIDRKNRNKIKLHGSFVPYIKKREDEDEEYNYYLFSSGKRSSTPGSGGGGGGAKRKTPRRCKKNRRRCESMVQLPPELLLAFAEEEDDVGGRYRRVRQQQLLQLAVASGGGGEEEEDEGAVVARTVSASPVFEPHSPTLDRWEEMQVALGDRESVVTTPRRRFRLMKKNKSEREMSSTFRETHHGGGGGGGGGPPTTVHSSSQPHLGLKQSQLHQPHYHHHYPLQEGASGLKETSPVKGPQLHQSGGSTSGGGGGGGGGGRRKHNRSNSNSGCRKEDVFSVKSSDAQLHHYHPLHARYKGDAAVGNEGGREGDDEEEEEDESYEEEESSLDEGESHVFGAWMGRSGTHPRRKGKAGGNALKQRSDDTWKWKS